MNFQKVIFVSACMLCLTACKITVTSSTGGSVDTESEAIQCEAGSSCNVDVNDLFFNETFIAVPAEGFEFVGWKSGDRALCGDSTDNCHLLTSGFEGNPVLMSLLENPEEEFFLEPGFRSTGFKSLFIGHSFFRPFAEGMPFHAEMNGIDEHSQSIVFSGGASGAPQALWQNSSKRTDIQSILDGGDIELFAMTYHPDYPTLEGYINWIEYAIAQNPATRFAIALPWGTEPHLYNSEEYAAGWHQFNEETIQLGIDELRRRYPESEIFSIPYGQAAAELRFLLDAGQLPDVSSLTGARDDAIFTDELGHAGEILIELGRLVWLNAIYGVDLNSYDYEPEYSTDLKGIAQSIMDAHDADYNAPYR